LAIAKKGIHKRIIVFLTINSPNFEPNTNQIIKEALENNITIYCVAVNYPAQQCMKDISEQTGGMYFEKIITAQDLEDCYKKILYYAMNTNFCEIEWKSDVQCNPFNITANLNLLKNNTNDSVSFTPPLTAVASLNATPAIVYFRNIPAGTKKDTTITLKAINSAFNVSNI